MRYAFLILSILFCGGITVVNAYEVVQTLDAPDSNISGLGYGNGSLWAVDDTSEYVYALNPATGAVSISWYIDNESRVPSGCTFTAGKVYIACGVPPDRLNSKGYIYNPRGTYYGYFGMGC